MDKDGSCKCPLAQAAMFCFSQGVRFTVIPVLWDVVCTYLVTSEANSGHVLMIFMEF